MKNDSELVGILEERRILSDEVKTIRDIVNTIYSQFLENILPTLNYPKKLTKLVNEVFQTSETEELLKNVPQDNKDKGTRGFYKAQIEDHIPVSDVSNFISGFLGESVDEIEPVLIKPYHKYFPETSSRLVAEQFPETSPRLVAEQFPETSPRLVAEQFLEYFLIKLLYLSILISSLIFLYLIKLISPYIKPYLLAISKKVIAISLLILL